MFVLVLTVSSDQLELVVNLDRIRCLVTAGGDFGAEIKS